MFCISSIFQFRMLCKLCRHSIIHLINNIFCCLWIVQSLSWNKHRRSHSCLSSIYLLLLVLISLLILWLGRIRRIDNCFLHALRITSSIYSCLLWVSACIIVAFLWRNTMIWGKHVLLHLRCIILFSLHLVLVSLNRSLIIYIWIHSILFLRLILHT